ncbi:hypothetical protein BRETT_000454 [Brettanomyces bruxellensis]|uniref:LIM zinc-binding domain-containing protein n=1 Tax=Dekkera bruxellensis TaxID=5007 RepID=A0A871RDW6_DEKBR|nr:uncharacterized protein BRETT_000454 [Brettanomyces bruxellensis]QOU20741.1 hypothetical protein BRETT_000454 [Brettanomyces bruxellensis]
MSQKNYEKPGVKLPDLLSDLPQFLRQPYPNVKFNSAFPPFTTNVPFRGVMERAGFDVYKPGKGPAHRHSGKSKHSSGSRMVSDSGLLSPNPLYSRKGHANYSDPSIRHAGSESRSASNPPASRSNPSLFKMGGRYAPQHTGDQLPEEARGGAPRVRQLQQARQGPGVRGGLSVPSSPGVMPGAVPGRAAPPRFAAIGSPALSVRSNPAGYSGQYTPGQRKVRVPEEQPPVGPFARAGVSPFQDSDEEDEENEARKNVEGEVRKNVEGEARKNLEGEERGNVKDEERGNLEDEERGDVKDDFTRDQYERNEFERGQDENSQFENNGFEKNLKDQNEKDERNNEFERGQNERDQEDQEDRDDRDDQNYQNDHNDKRNANPDNSASDGDSMDSFDAQFEPEADSVKQLLHMQKEAAGGNATATFVVPDIQVGAQSAGEKNAPQGDIYGGVGFKRLSTMQTEDPKIYNLPREERRKGDEEWDERRDAKRDAERDEKNEVGQEGHWDEKIWEGGRGEKNQSEKYNKVVSDDGKDSADNFEMSTIQEQEEAEDTHTEESSPVSAPSSADTSPLQGLGVPGLTKMKVNALRSPGESPELGGAPGVSRGNRGVHRHSLSQSSVSAGWLPGRGSGDSTGSSEAESPTQCLHIGGVGGNDAKIIGAGSNINANSGVNANSNINANSGINVNPNINVNSNINANSGIDANANTNKKHTNEIKYPPGQGPCRKCNQPILKGQKSIWSKDSQLSGQWHRRCFSCYSCNQKFTKGQSCYVYNDRPYCETHFHELNGSLCRICGKGVEGECLQNEVNEVFHTSCLKCCVCGAAIRTEYFIYCGKVLCEKDANEQIKLIQANSDKLTTTDKVVKRRTRLMHV